MARWRSGYAEVCKTLKTGSTPVRASNFFMSDILITSRPITPESDAYILLQQNNEYEKFLLKKDEPFHIELLNKEEKFCTGWYDIKTSTNYPCETHQLVQERYSDCYICRAKTGFNPAFYNTAEISATQEEFNKQPHSVYIAYFGDDVFKAGITATKRGLKRLYEQGALFHAIVANVPNANEARKLEARLIRNGLKESVLKSTKSGILKHSINKEKERAKFQEFVKTTNYPEAEIKSDIDLYFFDSYKEEPIKPFSDETTRSGKIKGIVGRYLILENNERLYGLWLSDYFGKKVTINDKITELERDLQQVSLF